MYDLVEIRNQLAQIQRAMGRVEGDVSAIRETQGARAANDKSLEERVRKLEFRQHFYSGAAAIVGAGLTLVGKRIFG